MLTPILTQGQRVIVSVKFRVHSWNGGALFLPAEYRRRLETTAASKFNVFLALLTKHSSSRSQQWKCETKIIFRWSEPLDQSVVAQSVAGAGPDSQSTWSHSEPIVEPRPVDGFGKPVQQPGTDETNDKRQTTLAPLEPATANLRPLFIRHHAETSPTKWNIKKFWRSDMQQNYPGIWWYKSNEGNQTALGEHFRKTVNNKIRYITITTSRSRRAEVSAYGTSRSFNPWQIPAGSRRVKAQRWFSFTR